LSAPTRERRGEKEKKWEQDHTLRKTILRAYWDRDPRPAIECPIGELFGTGFGETLPGRDRKAVPVKYAAVPFGMTEGSYYFRLPMPFRQHIRMEVENLTDKKFDGYTDVQWEKVNALPANTGCLRVAYRTGAPTIPEQTIEVCNVKGPGAIVAHWLQIQADHPKTVTSDLICEANHELYLDGSATPQIEYLGTEDCYGYSWGMGGGIQSDSYAAIIRIDRWKSGGLFTMLRCRQTDKINFETSCRWVINYQNEFFSSPELTKQPRLHGRASFPMPYRSAVYYYSAKP